MDQIKNYYEELVSEIIDDYAGNLSEEQLLDATCIALNKLPSRYYRCSISMRHHISIESEKTDSEIAQINKDIDNSIREAIDIVTKNPRNRYEPVGKVNRVRLNTFP